jgi:hypothetical protein
MQLALQIRQLYTHAPTLLTWVPLGILGQFPIDLLMAFRDSPTMIIEVPHTVYWSERGWAKGICMVCIHSGILGNPKDRCRIVLFLSRLRADS